jgi:hypothetical protein
MTSPQDDDAKRKMIALPLEKKLSIIQKIYVRDEVVGEAWEVLSGTVAHGLRLREASTGYIIGESRCGKSEAVKRFLFKRHGRYPVKGLPFQLIEGNGHRTVWADMTNGATPLIATKMLLSTVFRDIGVRARMSESEAAIRLIEVLPHHEVDLFIVEEAQMMFNGHGPGSALKLSNWLLPLENAALFKTILVGAPELLEMFTQVLAAGRRHGGIARLDPFAFRTAKQKNQFARFVASFVKDLPVASTCIMSEETGKCDPRRLADLYYATRGVRGIVAKLMEFTLIGAHKRAAAGSNVERLELEDFALGFDYLLKHDPLMRNVNPFRVANENDIPSHPLTPQEAEDARHKTIVPRVRRPLGRSKPGGRINVDL